MDQWKGSPNPFNYPPPPFLPDLGILNSGVVIPATPTQTVAVQHAAHYQRGKLLSFCPNQTVLIQHAVDDHAFTVPQSNGRRSTHIR